MRNAGFIVAVEPYLVRTGLVSVLNRIQGVRVIREFGMVEPFLLFTKKNPGYFMVISQSIFNSAGEFFFTFPGILGRIILLAERSSTEGFPEIETIIHPGDSREEITTKILTLLEHQRQEGPVNPAEILTQRERTIVRLVSMGLTNRQIADQLYLSTHTVITHRKNISNKLGIKSVSGLTVYAIVNNIITIEEVTSRL
jgi:DNA-binding CsgD family transcriptional regulator